jgi:hypothetical protein
VTVAQSLSDGDYRRGPYVSVVGRPTDFYVYVMPKGERGEPSKWIKGEHRLWFELARLHKKDRTAFVVKCSALLKERGYMY